MITLKIGQRVRWCGFVPFPDERVENGGLDGTIVGMERDEWDDFYVRVSFDDGDTRECAASELEDLEGPS